jgi:hypothetical protein
MPDMSSPDNTKTSSTYDMGRAAGTTKNPGPYVGIVKNNVDPLRIGRLQVWIPELGGVETDPSSWRTVTYASPFYGVTPNEIRGTNGDFRHSPHSYGFWAVPPDISVKVLCAFVNGDASRGYWFACIPEWPNVHMVPDIAANQYSGPEPVVDFNDNGSDPEGTDATAFFARPKTAHDIQKNILNEQGLLGDGLRGAGTSSAQRESPSRVFGWSTPGPPLTEPTDNPSANEPNAADQRVVGRRGGHRIVMDDGQADGSGAKMKLRSGGGNMILLSDEGNFVYMINGKGSAWMELAGDGSINAWAAGSVSIKADGPMKLEGDSVSIQAKLGQVSIFGGTGVSIFGATVSLSGIGSVSVAGMSVDICGMSVGVTGNMCVNISGGTGISLSGACVAINSKPPTPCNPIRPQFPFMGMPTHEPWSGHVGKAGNPTFYKPYAADNGVPSGPASGYGAAGSYSGMAPNTNIGSLPSDAGPAKAVSGLMTVAGQGSNTGSLASASQFDLKSTVLTATDAAARTSTILAKTAVGVGLAMDLTNNAALSKLGTNPNQTGNTALGVGSPTLSRGEKVNNPGNLLYTTDLQRAVGSLDLAMFARPEDGYYDLALSFIRTSENTGKSDLLTLMKALRPDLSESGIKVYARFVQDTMGTAAGNSLDLFDADTMRRLVIAVTIREQSRCLYSYDQIEVGIADAQNRRPENTAAQQPWNNSSASSGGTGFVAPVAGVVVSQLVSPALSNLKKSLAVPGLSSVTGLLNGSASTPASSTGQQTAPVSGINTNTTVYRADGTVGTPFGSDIQTTGQVIRGTTLQQVQVSVTGGDKLAMAVVGATEGGNVPDQYGTMATVLNRTAISQQIDPGNTTQFGGNSPITNAFAPNQYTGATSWLAQTKLTQQQVNDIGNSWNSTTDPAARVGQLKDAVAQAGGTISDAQAQKIVGLYDGITSTDQLQQAQVSINGAVSYRASYNYASQPGSNVQAGGSDRFSPFTTSGNQYFIAGGGKVAAVAVDSTKPATLVDNRPIESTPLAPLFESTRSYGQGPGGVGALNVTTTTTITTPGQQVYSDATGYYTASGTTANTVTSSISPQQAVAAAKLDTINTQISAAVTARDNALTGTDVTTLKTTIDNVTATKTAAEASLNDASTKIDQVTKSYDAQIANAKQNITAAQGELDKSIEQYNSITDPEVKATYASVVSINQSTLTTATNTYTTLSNAKDTAIASIKDQAAQAQTTIDQSTATLKDLSVTQGTVDVYQAQINTLTAQRDQVVSSVSDQGSTQYVLPPASYGTVSQQSADGFPVYGPGPDVSTGVTKFNALPLDVPGSVTTQTVVPVYNGEGAQIGQQLVVNTGGTTVDLNKLTYTAPTPVSEDLNSAAQTALQGPIGPQLPFTQSTDRTGIGGLTSDNYAGASYGLNGAPLGATFQNVSDQAKAALGTTQTPNGPTGDFVRVAETSSPVTANDGTPVPPVRPDNLTAAAGDPPVVDTGAAAQTAGSGGVAGAAASGAQAAGSAAGALGSPC